jgi:lysophospholipase L1-like esterase
MPLTGDDSRMNRFDRHGLRRFRARDAVLAVALAALVLVLFEGASIRRAGEAMNPGVGRDLVLAVGRPAGWIADRLPLAAVARSATTWLSPDQALSSSGSFAQLAQPAPAGGTPPVTADAFDPVTLGQRPPPRRPLKTLLVTGDSMSSPLDDDLARRLVSSGVRVIRDPHLGSGISKSFLVDWGELSASQVKRDRPGAVVVFIGANEGFPIKVGAGRAVKCCGPGWAAAYATRARAMMNTYRQNGAARVYWIALPTPRSAGRAAISRVVNAAIEVAAEPWRSQVRVIDTTATFTPHGYRDAMPINGTPTIVREPDGIHLNDAGSGLLTAIVLGRLRQDFTLVTG